MKVIYLHGFASSPASSKAQFFTQKFKDAGFEVSVPALDGGDFRNLTITSQLDIVERAASGSEHVILMGSSLGGYLTAVYAARHPEQVEKAIMMAPAFCFARRWSAELPALEEWKRTGLMELFHYGDKRTREISYNLITDGLEYEDYPEVAQPARVWPVWQNNHFRALPDQSPVQNPGPIRSSHAGHYFVPSPLTSSHYPPRQQTQFQCPSFWQAYRSRSHHPAQ